jgi:transposase InsO family protein
LIIADALSRTPSRNIEKSESDFENDTTAFVDMIMESFPASNNRLQEMRREQASDPIIQELSRLCREGWTKKSKVRTDLLSYWPMHAEFDGLLLKGTSLVIPAVLQRDILSRLHEAHQGIVKCRERARNTVWWYGINKQLDEVVRNCRTCAETRSDKAEPMMCSEFSNRPREKVASDLFEHNKQSYLFVVDYYSRYIEIAKLHSTSSNAVINHLKSIFARHGIPQTFISDNGPQYCGNAFREIAKSYGF